MRPALATRLESAPTDRIAIQTTLLELVRAVSESTDVAGATSSIPAGCCETDEPTIVGGIVCTLFHLTVRVHCDGLTLDERLRCLKWKVYNLPVVGDERHDVSRCHM